MTIEIIMTVFMMMAMVFMVIMMVLMVMVMVFFCSCHCESGSPSPPLISVIPLNSLVNMLPPFILPLLITICIILRKNVLLFFSSLKPYYHWLQTIFPNIVSFSCSCSAETSQNNYMWQHCESVTIFQTKETSTDDI